MNVICTQYKKNLGSLYIFFYKWHKLAFEIDYASKKSAQNGKNVDF
jgi:hypothetical protein